MFKKHQIAPEGIENWMVVNCAYRTDNNYTYRTDCSPLLMDLYVFSKYYSDIIQMFRFNH